MATSASEPHHPHALVADADALFLTGRFGDAVLAYESALSALPDGPGRQSVERRLERARVNRDTGLSGYEAQAAIFGRLFRPESVQSGPRPGSVASAAPDLAPRRSAAQSAAHTAAVAVGRVVGSVGSAVLHQLTAAAGRQGTNGTVWTTWYSSGGALPGRLRGLVQVLKLAHMREELFANNLVRTYPRQVKTGFVAPPEEPPAWARRWRTADGSWNDLDRDADGRYDPMVGAAYTRFFRNVGDDIGLEAVHARTDPAKDPVSVREVSRAVFAPRGKRTLAPFLNLWAAVWIQFMTHDWVSHGTTTSERTSPLPLAEDDQLREYGIDRLDVRTSPLDPTRQPYEEAMPPTFLNEVTHWWDGSQIYGSDADTLESLRSHVGGRMLVDDEGLLPIDPSTGTEVTGFSRNWWVAMGVIHTLFVREHNAIADHLAAAYPDWDDDALFHTARLINVAVMAKIHTVEWTPSFPTRPLPTVCRRTGTAC
jgi:hypothetical protein